MIDADDVLAGKREASSGQPLRKSEMPDGERGGLLDFLLATSESLGEFDGDWDEDADRAAVAD